MYRKGDTVCDYFTIQKVVSGKYFHYICKNLKTGLLCELWPIEKDIDISAVTSMVHRIRNSHMPSLNDIIEDELGYYIVSDTIEGDSIAALVTSGDEFSEKDIIHIVEELIGICRYLHMENNIPVIHGGICPENVYITSENRLMLKGLDVKNVCRLADVQVYEQFHNGFRSDIRDLGNLIEFLSVNGDGKRFSRIIRRSRGEGGYYEDILQVDADVKKIKNRKRNIIRRTAAIASVAALMAAVILAHQGKTKEEEITVLGGYDSQYHNYMMQAVPEEALKDIELPVIYDEDADVSEKEYVLIKGKKYKISSGMLDLSNQGLENYDISEISRFKKLRVLNLDGNNISDLSEIAKVKSIEYLWLDQNKITDTGPLAKLPDLRQLTLNGNPVSDISSLAELKNLDQLCIQATNITDISAVSGMSSLTKLMINMNNIPDISPLEDLDGLEQLYAGKCGISDISVLSGKKKLRILYINDNAITDISALKNCNELVYVDLHKNQISDIEALSKKKKLTQLNLADNNITDAECIFNDKSLEYLALSRNPLTSADGAAALSSLRSLYLRNTLITNANFIRLLPKLENVSIVRCKIPAEQVDKIENDLTKVRFTVDYY